MEICIEGVLIVCVWRKEKKAGRKLGVYILEDAHGL